MSKISTRIQPCLWFDGQAEEAAKFYVSVFPGSKLGAFSRYAEAGKDIHGKQPGSVMTVAFELDGQPFLALNGGPYFKFSEAVSLMVLCDTQEEIDHYWNALSQGGDPAAQQCGWLKDRYGLSWQITPAIFAEMITSSDRPAMERYMAALMTMKKLDIAQLQAAFEGR
ncbi:VOC family protein [Ottowia sp. VDI28]|uniref:VOC family protein n=1 Tax=Ottowia sp. VDI28 TaxID=3133968 RepID=UPI003C30D5D0